MENAQRNISYNIFLIGFMGTGKSTVAGELSKLLQTENLEMDAMIVEQQGMPISEIFEKYGEDHFRDLESQLLIDLQQRESAVVSCGGGVVVRPGNSQYMKKRGKVVLLTALPETVFERVRCSQERPILNDNMNVEFIEELMEKRRDKYLEAADLVIATDGKSAEEICREIMEKLGIGQSA